jgi:hypothetical protein
MLYLIGTDHSVQHDGRAGYHGPEFERIGQGFPEFLVQAAKSIQAKVIAEESNEDVLSKFSATQSVASTVASGIAIKHLFCEPSIAEREQLGITTTGSPADFEKREKFWLERLKSIEEAPILFVLGADHVESFSELTKTSGLSVEVVDEYYGGEYFAP